MKILAKCREFHFSGLIFVPFYVCRNKEDIMASLADQTRALGLRADTPLFVHASLKAVGAGTRAEDLLAALEAAMGPAGTAIATGSSQPSGRWPIIAG